MSIIEEDALRYRTVWEADDQEPDEAYGEGEPATTHRHQLRPRADKSQRIDWPVGVDNQIGLDGLRACTVIAANYSSQYAYIPAGNIWMPPGAMGWCIPIQKATETAMVLWSVAPPGLTQPAAVGGGVLVTWWTEAELPPSMANSETTPSAPDFVQLLAGVAAIGTVSGTQSPADALATPADAVDVRSFLEAFNGATSDRLRTVSALGSGLGVLLSSGVPLLSQSGTSGANAAQTLTITGVAGQRIRVANAYAIASAAGAGGAISDGASLSFACNATGGGTALTFGGGGLVAAVGASVTFVIGAAGAANTTTASLAWFIA